MLLAPSLADNFVDPTEQRIAAAGRLDPPMCDRYRYGENGLSNVECLIADIGHCPPGKTIGRINNDLGYIVGNVRWETPQEQANNRRSNSRWTLDDRTQTQAQWLREWGWPRYKFNNSIVYWNRRLARMVPPSATDADPLELTEASLRKAGFTQSVVTGEWMRHSAGGLPQEESTSDDR